MLRFTKKRTSGITRVIPGVGNYTVAVAYIPNFIQVQFSDSSLNFTGEGDTVEWSLANAGTGYILTIFYNCDTVRHIRHVIAKLPVNPEHQLYT